jgi:Ran GTPase-activating protein (RanGAP) involved in mRNA processing and transport
VPSNVLLVINPTASDKKSTKRSARNDLSRTERSSVSESESKEESEMVTAIDTPGYKLFGSQNLSHINLRNACVFDDGAWALSSFMCRNSFVKVLDLSHNLISDEGMQAIATGLRNFVGLESLKLSGNGFGYDGCRYIRQTLQHSSTLTCLELTNNRIGDDGAEILADMLTHHLSIKELYLDSCLIGDYGVEKLGKALESNRVIQKLMLSNNRITKIGIQRFMTYVQLNGMLKELSLKYNDIGSEGVRLVGEMLLMNDSIRKLDLSHTNMFSGRSAMGIHAIGTALRTKNKGLQELVMVGNNLRDDCILEFAYSLYFNRGLLVCDLRGNHISEDWLKPETYLLTKLMDQLPSIQTSLDRNAALRKDPQLAEKYDVKPRPMEDEAEGRWTVRRRWRKLNKKGERELQEARENNEEQGRINAEEEYIATHLSESMNTLEKFLMSLEGHNFLKAIGKVVSQYIDALAEGAEATLAENMKKNESGALAAKAVIDALAKEAESSKAKVILSNIVARKEEAERKVRQAAEEERAKKALELALQQQDLAKKKHEELSSNWETRSHLGIVSSIFMTHGCDDNFFVSPEKLDRIFLSLCLPLKEEDAIVALNKTVGKLSVYFV